MSANSSADSWAAHHGADIIDLDRYMRGGVRPQQRPRKESGRNLVVDAGGMAKVPLETPTPYKTDSTTNSLRRGKRYSHDSGLSDGSRVYVRRRSLRRRTERESSTLSSRQRGHTTSSTDSLRNFRAVYERALRDQQEQIARVAQICERLTIAVPKFGTVSKNGPAFRRTSTQESSDITSSSLTQSTRDRMKKDKHRSDECKTYKIIMTKLDELNRVLGKRARSTPSRRRLPFSTSQCQAPSSDSVSVSDKLISTEPAAIAGYALTTTGYRPTVQTPFQSPHQGSRVADVSRRVAQLATAYAHEIDIAPAPSRHPPMPHRSDHLNGIERTSIVESVYEENEDESAEASPIDQFDLNDPVKFYSQAKQLQAKISTMTSTLPPPARAHTANYTYHQSARSSDSVKSNISNHKSLCSLCKAYWRSLSAMAAQIFARTEETR